MKLKPTGTQTLECEANERQALQMKDIDLERRFYKKGAIVPADILRSENPLLQNTVKFDCDVTCIINGDKSVDVYAISGAESICVIDSPYPNTYHGAPTHWHCAGANGLIDYD